MSINLKNFVNIDFKHLQSGSILSTRKTTILFTSRVDFDNTYTSYNEYRTSSERQAIQSESISLDSYCKFYFSNGGQSLHIITYTLADLPTLVKALDYKDIVITFDNPDVSQLFTNLGTIFDEEDYTNSINNKKVLIGLSKANLSSLIDETLSLPDFKTNIDVIYNGDAIGIEMCIAAYLSKINVYETESVQDYMYTSINTSTIQNFNINTFNDTYFSLEGKTDDELFNFLNTNHIIAFYNLLDNVVSINGNDLDGRSLTNEWTLIVLKQTLTERAITVLKTKLKNTTGVNKLYSALVAELYNYKSNGYLSTDKVWTDEDYVVTEGLSSYTVISQDTALLDGFVVYVLPLSSLTEEERLQHLSPKIYVIIADQYAIRKVNIIGKVL